MSDASDTTAGAPQIPDHELLRKIGEGSFGQVWIARSKATGRHRAVKLILRSRFHDDRPFEVEFAGVRKFEEVSREHEGFVDILHISRDDQAGYFAYVMELADDVQGGSPLNPDSYAPRTLAAEVKRHGRLAPSECVRVALDLTAALGELHRRSLVHRDIKPTNIVFVRGAPKLADIGLVTEIRSEEAVAENPTFTGTPDFIDPRVHGTARGDLFSFGKVLYQIATGLHPRDFPSLPDEIRNTAEPEVFWELNRIFSKACDTDPAARFTTAEEIHEELKLLNAGTWVIRWKRWLWLFKALRRYGVLALCLLVFAGVAFYQRAQWRQKAAEVRQRKVLYDVAYGARAAEDGNLAGALSWYAEAMSVDAGNPESKLTHQLRIGSTLRQCPRLVQMWIHKPGSGFQSFAGRDDRLMSSAASGRWAIHDVATGDPIGEPFGTRAPYETAFLCPATGRVVTADNTGDLRLWDTRSPAPARTFTYGPTNVLWPATLSPDGRWMAACMWETNLPGAIHPAPTNTRPARERYAALVWDLSDPEAKPRRYDTDSRLIHLAFSPDSRRLVAGLQLAYRPGRVSAIVWDNSDGQVVATSSLHTNWVYHCAFSPDGRRVASAGADATVRVWGADSGRPEVAPMIHGAGVNSVEYSPDGRFLVTSGWDSVVRVWEADTGRLVHRLEQNANAVYACFSPSGNFVVALAMDGIVRVWNLRLPEREPPSLPIAASGDGTRLARAAGGRIEILSATNDALVGSIAPTNQNRFGWMLSRDGGRVLTVLTNVVAGSTGFTAQVWSTVPTQAMPPISMDRPPLQFSPDGRRLFDGVTVWDLDQGNPALTLDSPARVAAFDPSSRALAIGRRKRCEVWTWAGTNPVLTSNWTNATDIRSLSWDATGRRIVVSGAEGSFVQPDAAEIRDAASGRRLAGPFGHDDGVLFSAFSGDGRLLITCGEDNVAVLWSADNGARNTPPLVHRAQVTHAAFSPDDRFVATASSDGSVRVWDSRTAEPLTPILPHRESVVRVQFVGGVRFLLTQTKSGATRLWPLPVETREAGELARIAQLLSGRQSHRTEAMLPQSKEDIRQLWQDLRRLYTNEFSFRP